MLTHESHPPQHGAQWVLWLVTAEDVVVDHFIGGDVELVEQHGGPMSKPILVGYDPVSADHAPVNFGVAAARFTGAPLIVASVSRRKGAAAGEIRPLSPQGRAV